MGSRILDFRLLGPLEVRAGGRQLDVGGVRQQRILATLLLSPNRVVPLSRLFEAAWDTELTATARRQVQNRVAALRAILTRSGGFIDTRDAGYLLRVAPGELDVLVFDDLVERGRAGRDAGLLRQALALWRGPALAGLGGRLLSLEAAVLEEKRLVAWEDCLELEMSGAASKTGPGASPGAALGAALGATLDELRELVAAHPLRERFVGQLMRASHRTGRRDEALSAYRELARRLADDLGVDPSPALRSIHREIQNSEIQNSGIQNSELDGEQPAGERGWAPVPAQLPADVAGFTGRVEAMAWLDGTRSGPGHAGNGGGEGHGEGHSHGDGDGDQREPDPPRTVLISAIAGMAGVGKTALAVHWAHRVRDEFPDGELYVNLRGFAPTPPMRPIDALAGFLRALGVPPDQVPVEVDEAAARYRGMLADKRMLVLLDNAASVAQVRPLLPGGPGCVTIVTSRDALDGMTGPAVGGRPAAGDGARRLTLGVFAAEEARALLGRLLGVDRVDAESSAAAELARLCAYLPLALRIAAANLADGEPIGAYVARLAAGNRLAGLTVEGDEQAAVRATFDLSYATLASPARRLFRLLGLVPGPDVTAPAAAALAGVAVPEAAALLDRLAAAHLIERRGVDRYVLHDLLRLYAVEHVATDEESAVRDGALRRLYDFYLHGARAAVDVVYPGVLRLPLPDRPAGNWSVPGFDDDGAALEWLDAERADLVVAVTEAPVGVPPPAIWLLADTMRIYLHISGHITELTVVAGAGLAAAEAAGELPPQAMAHIALGRRCVRLSRYPEALDHLRRALDAGRETGWLEAQSAALSDLAEVYRLLGRPRLCAEHMVEVVALDRRLGWEVGVAADLAMLGIAYLEMGEADRSAECEAEAAAMYRDSGNRGGEAMALDYLAQAYHALGRLDDTREVLARAQAILREAGFLGGDIDVLRTLAVVHLDLGEEKKAFEYAESALAAAREVRSNRCEADALNTLAGLCDQVGRAADAIEHYTRALRVARDSGDRYPEVEAMAGLGSAHARAGRHGPALDWAEQALAAATEAGYGALAARAGAVVAGTGADTAS